MKTELELAIPPSPEMNSAMERIMHDMLPHPTDINHTPPILDIETIISYLETINAEMAANFPSLEEAGLVPAASDLSTVESSQAESNSGGSHITPHLQFTTLEEHLGPAILPLEVKV